MVDAFYNYCYYIEFLYDQRDWGYCDCSPNDSQYNARHSCCGMGCDWTAPAFSLTKEIGLHHASWNGYERDYWEYEEKFNENESNKNKLVEEYRKEMKKKAIMSEIKRLESQLENVEI